MHTSVATQKLVTVTMSVDEWAEWLEENPRAFLIQIQNIALADVEPASNGHKPRKSPKAPARRKTRKTPTSYVCDQCGKKFKTEIRYHRHMDRNHTTAAPAAED